MNIKARGKIGDQIKHAAEQIAMVHGDGNLPKVEVNESGTRNINGQFVRNAIGPPEINISKHGEWPALTMAHETGHFLDYDGIPMPYKIGGARDFAGDPRFADWIKAVENSDAFKVLKSVSQKTTVTVPASVHPVAAGMWNVDRTHTAYLLRWREIWARAYAQYIPTRTGDVELMAQLDKRRDPGSWYHQVYRSQWEDADFEPIALAMDAVFKGLGWIQ
jgi:hypothetical protein